MPTRYADALAEAGIGKTCAAGMQAADAWGVVSRRRALCGVAKKTVTVISCMELLWWS